MGFKNLAELNEGTFFISGFRRAFNAAAVQNVGYDTSITPGYPSPNYYASSPLEARYMSHTRNGGLYHGKAVGPDKSKYLYETHMVGSNASCQRMQFILMDYLLYYPFIDEGVTDVQEMINNETLPRYTDGKGVMMMAISVAAATGGQSFTVNYTNSKGVSGRVTPTIFMHVSSMFNGSTISAAINTSQLAGCLFLPLQDGDEGVRSIQSVTMNGTDVGLFTIVLVKPLMSSFLGDFRCVTNKNSIVDNGFAMPKIEDDAYLNFLVVSTGTFAGTTLIGTNTFLVK